MISAEFEEAIKPIKRLYHLLWFSLTTAIVLYLMVLIIRSDSAALLPSAIDPLVRVILTVVAVLVGIGSLLYHRYTHSESYLRRMMSRDIQLHDIEEKARKLTAQAKSNSSTGSSAKASLAMLTAFDRQRYALAADGFVPFVLNLALNEAVALLGFVLAILSRDIWPYLPFAVAAMALNIYMLPRLDNLMERCEIWRTVS